ncbi:MAG TPA: ATPase domain-containing protein [Thermoplasmata archaeon]|nr:ATPase domain-containing protein [Thermoplasmata archaeon]
MATKTRAEEISSHTCGVCGGPLGPAGSCTICGTKHDIRDGLPVPANANAAPKTNGESGLARWLSGESGDQGLQAWLGGSRGASSLPGDPARDALRKWLTGEEGALDVWLGGAFSAAGAGTVQVAAAPEAEPSDDLQGRLDARDRDARARQLEIDGLRAELEAIRGTMRSELSKIKSGRFDPVKYIEETAALNKQLQTEITTRKELEEEIEHIKKGSIAVIKYVKGQQLKSGASPHLKKKLAEEDVKRRQLEGRLQETQKFVATLKAQIDRNLLNQVPESRELKQKELALAEREAELAAKEAGILALREAAEAGTLAAPGAGTGEDLRHRFEESLREKEREFLKKEDELKKRVITLEEDVNKHKIEEKFRAESAALEGKSKTEVDVIFAKKEQELLGKEKSILIREQEIQRLKEELATREEEFRRVKEPLAYKEEELMRREEDLVYRDRLLQAERQKLDQAKALGGGTAEVDLKERLEQLKAEIAQKEEEVRAKEKYLTAKMDELRLREQGLIEEEIDSREQERMLEVKQDKVKTGTPRLDDLLLGGVPFGSNVTIYGPAHVGKEVIVNAFMAESLKKGIPVIWVLTDKMPSDIREEMTFVLPSYEEYEKLGLVKYIDAYSKSMGADTEDRYTTYIADLTDFASISKVVDALSMGIKKKHPYYRLAFRSVSTVMAYLDHTTTFKFLQPFVGRRRRDKSVAMYVIEKGMHEDKEIEMLSSMMDGTLEFKVEQLRSFLAVRGVCDVQSRAWIKYTHTRSAVSVGSFSLELIK